MVRISDPSGNETLTMVLQGTWQDSTTAQALKYPTNVTRFSRALSPFGTGPNGEKIQQIIFYQPGVGTGFGSVLAGGERTVRLSKGRNQH